MEDHSGHGGHQMPSGPTCKMNMLFNWQVEDTCVVFQWWHISGPWSLLTSCIAVFIIAAFYEWIRAYAAALESNWQQSALFQRNGNSQSNEEEQEQENVVYAYQQYTRLLSNKRELARSAIYAILVGISFWLMLVFMTYNGYLMIATVLGAGFGHYFFGNGKLGVNKSIQCH
ncbi:Ctr copper transporter [Rhizopus microsporus ATCC 52813]|uniref:Copper transport protein n=1 Tax=Rhizopus microsporus ATCC 52813 TaxID=1340429 RepID=A0A2G4SQT5_RHIZD|nr:Ctr copper transporter [Rhizopus microsporus ATCC 52813]PHZ11131.1 Ctr copper transporter [Rhizopus microsporus ATCC 52813]